jgi:hypothetical protein
MRVHNSTRYAAIAALLGGLACAGNKARTNDGTEQAAAARDTTTTRDTVGGQTENPPGYRGMERDTTMVPRTGQTPSDTFLQKQGQGSPQDTSGYSGIERDTTHRAGVSDSTGYRRDSTGYGRDSTGYGADTTGASRSRDTSGTASADSSSLNKSNGGALDSTGMSRTGDTTGYHPSQQAPRDSTAR